MFIQTHDGDFVPMSKIEFLGVRKNSIYASGPADLDGDIQVISLGYYEQDMDAEFVLNHMIQFMAKYEMKRVYRMPEDLDDCELL